jgi:predicted house-cleaning NTP pyrophosphatase (Maf/HAM1 superfamily)/tRNA-dihydrouridine synthase/2'-5' RNA ligase
LRDQVIGFVAYAMFDDPGKEAIVRNAWLCGPRAVQAEEKERVDALTRMIDAYPGVSLSEVRAEVREAGIFGDWAELQEKARETRASWLLDPAYILHDWMVLQTVNPGFRPFRMLYGAAGVDLSNALLSTDLNEAFFVSDYYGWTAETFGGGVVAALKSLEDPDKRRQLIAAEGADQYRTQKNKWGYGIGDLLHVPAGRLSALAVELDALGIENVRVTSLGQYPVLRFRWQHPLGDEAKLRTVTLIDADITRPVHYTSFLEGLFDAYYQRAGQEVPLDYEGDSGFIAELRGSLSEEGHFITDDYAYRSVPEVLREIAFSDRGNSFPLDLSLVSIPRYDELTASLLRLRGGRVARDTPAHRYGWDVRIRKNATAKFLSSASSEIRRSEARRTNEKMTGTEFATKYKIARNALAILKKAGSSEKGSAILRAFEKLVDDDPQGFAEFMSSSLEDDTEVTEEFLTEVLRRRAGFADPAKDARIDFSGLGKNSLSVHILSSSDRKINILNDMFQDVAARGIPTVENKGKEPDPKTGSPSSQVQAISIWKTMKGYFDSTQPETLSREDALWVGGDTLLFVGGKKLGKPGEDPGAVLAAHHKLAGNTADAVSAATLIKIQGGKLRVQLVTDRAKITFRSMGDTIPEKDLKALEMVKTALPTENYRKVGETVTVGDYWDSYREANLAKLKDVAAGFMIQDEASFPMVEQVVGDPRVIMGFPARLAAHQLRLDGLEVNILANDNHWNYENAGKKIIPFSDYWDGKFHRAANTKDKDAVVKEFFEFTHKWPQMAAQQFWELRRFEEGWSSDLQKEGSLYVRALARYLSKEQKEAESILQRMIQLERSRRDLLPVQMRENSYIDFFTTNEKKVAALRILVGNGDKKGGEDVKPQNPGSGSFFQKKLKAQLLADSGTDPALIADRKGAIMALAFEKMWDSLGVKPGSSKFVMTTETQMFLCDERDSTTQALDESQGEGAQVKAIGGQAVEASSAVALASQETGEVRFGYGIAFLEMHAATDKLDDDEQTLLLRELDSSNNQKDGVLAGIKKRILNRWRSDPVTVGDVRYFFEKTNQGIALKQGKLLLVQDPLFFTTVSRLYGEPTAAIAFPWQDTIDLLTHFKTDFSYPKGKKERQARSQKAIMNLLNQPSFPSKIKEVSSRQLEDARKKIDFYGRLRMKYLDQAASERSYLRTHKVIDLTDDFNVRTINALLNASRLSLQMVQFRKAVEYIQVIYRTYINDEKAVSGSPESSQSFIKKVYQYLDREIEKAGPGAKGDQLKKDKEYWKAFEVYVRYINEQCSLDKDADEKLRQHEEREFLKLLGDGTEPFGSRVWDLNVAPLGEQTELFRRLNDVVNVWNQWDPSESLAPDRAIDLDSVSKEKTPSLDELEELEKAPKSCFLTDGIASDFYNSPKDQYAGEKILRLHSGLKSLMRDEDKFKTHYTVDFKKTGEILKQMETVERRKPEKPTVDEKRVYEDTMKELHDQIDVEVGFKYRDLLAVMVASDFEEDFPFRKMNLLQSQKFINDQSLEMMGVMWDTLAANRVKGKPTTVSVYFNNAGAESWWNLYQVFLLLQLGFDVSIIVPEAPTLNKDVTAQDIQFMLPYMDAYLKRIYGADIGRPLADASMGRGEHSLKIEGVRIEERPGPVPGKSERDSAASYPARLQKDLELINKEPLGFEDALRRNLVKLIKKSHFNILVGELWYGYFAGMGELSTDPINAIQEKDKGWEERKDLILGSAIDSEEVLGGRSLDLQGVTKKIRTDIGTKGHVLTVHVHKNVRQQVDAFSEPGADGREKGGLPDPVIIYGSPDSHYFYPNAWRRTNPRFYYRGTADIEKLLNDEDARRSMLKLFREASKFYFGTQEDLMDVLVRDVTDLAKSEEAKKEDPKDIEKAYDFIYRTPTRAIRFRFCTYRGDQLFKKKNGDFYEKANGHFDIQFGVNYEPLLRSAQMDNGETLMTRFMDWPMLQSKIPSLFCDHVRNSFIALLEEQKKKTAAMSTDFEVIDPEADYLLDEKKIETKRDLGWDKEKGPFVFKLNDGKERRQPFDAVALSIKLNEDDPLFNNFFAIKNPVAGASFVVQLLKYFDEENGMGRLATQVPASIEMKDGAPYLVFSIPNVHHRLEVLDIFKLPGEGEEFPVSMMKKEKHSRFFIIRSDLGPLGRIPKSRLPSDETRQTILEKNEGSENLFWFKKVLKGKMDLPGGIVAPIDYRSQADERLMIQEVLEKDFPALIYSDLSRIGEMQDAHKGLRWWSNYAFTTGLPRLDVSSRENFPIVQLAGPHDVALGNMAFEVDDPATKDHAGDSPEEKQRKKELRDQLREEKVAKAFRVAAFLAVKNGAKGININMGSASLNAQFGADGDITGGSGLLKRSKLAAAIVRESRKGAMAALGIDEAQAKFFPVSVKTRLAEKETGPNVKPEDARMDPKVSEYHDARMKTFMRAVINAGASWITIRTIFPSHSDSHPAELQREIFMKLIQDLQKEEVEDPKFKLPPIYINGGIKNARELDAVQKLAKAWGVRLQGVMLGTMLSTGKNYDLLRLALRQFPENRISPERSVAAPPLTNLTDKQKADMAKHFLRFMSERLGLTFFPKSRIQPSLFSFVKNVGIKEDPKEDQDFLNTIRGLGTDATSDEIIGVLKKYAGNSENGLARKSDSRSEVRGKIETQLRKITDDVSSGLREEQIPGILAAVENGSLKLKGEDLDIIKVVDGKEIVIGAIDRNIAHKYGLMHRVPTTFIVTPEGKFLIQRRSHNIVQPLMLALFGGHVKTGHSYLDTLKDEIVEELALPKGWPVDEKRIKVIRGEGAFKWAPDTGDTNNREMRSHYVYFASAEEIEKIRATGKLLEAKLSELGDARYKAWLESEQKATNGLGEVWSIHEYSYDELMQLDPNELSSDLLAPLLHDLANQDVRATLKSASKTAVEFSSEVRGKDLKQIYDDRMKIRDLDRLGIVEEYATHNQKGGKLADHPKFSPDLKEKPFKGFTTLAHVNPGTVLDAKLKDLRSRIIQRMKEAGHESEIAFLDPHFHMTFVDLDAGATWFETGVDQRKKQVEKAFAEIGTPGSLTAHVRGVGMASSIAATVWFDSEENLRKALGIEEKIKAATGVKKRPMAGHISLAYLVKYPGEAGMREIVDILKEFQNEDLGEFRVDDIDLSYFSDMNHYETLLSKNLSTGKVTISQERSQRVRAEEERSSLGAWRLLPKGNSLMGLVLGALYEYRLADALEILARGRAQLEGNDRKVVEQLVVDFPPAQYSAENGWNTSRVDLEEQTALFRGIEHALNQLSGWPERQTSVDPVKTTEISRSLVLAADPHAFRKQEIFKNGVDYLERIFTELFPGRAIEASSGWSDKLAALLPFILQSNRMDDLSRAPENRSFAQNYLKDDRNAFRGVMDSADKKSIAILLDNLGGETFGLLLAAWIMVRMGKTVTVYAKKEPTILSDTTLPDLERSLSAFDQSMRTRFGDRFGSGLKGDMKDGKLLLRESPGDYLYRGEKAEGHKIVSVDFNFLAAFDAAVIMGELQYGDFMRGQLRRIYGTIADARKRNAALLNPFPNTTLVFLKTNKNAREVNVGVEATAHNPAAPTRGEFVAQVLSPAEAAPSVRSEVRKNADIKNKMVPLRATSRDSDAMVRRIRKNVQPATVFVDAEDFSNLSLTQKQEYLIIALSNRALRMVVYNERGQAQDKELEALLKLDRVTRTDKDLAGAQISFARPNMPSIHLSKKILPSSELVERLKKKIVFFKSQGEKSGSLAVALLWALGDGEGSRFAGVNKDSDGFWRVAESLVDSLQRSYDNNLVFASAA